MRVKLPIRSCGFAVLLLLGACSHQDQLGQEYTTGTAMYGVLAEDVVDATSDQGVQLYQLGDTLRITIPSDALFAVYDNLISPTGNGVLSNVYNILSNYPTAKITITAYTDTVGNFQYNQQLSEDQARSVLAYFWGQGISSWRMQSAGDGQNNPIASDLTLPGMARNRRVEIVVSPVGGDHFALIRSFFVDLIDFWIRPSRSC